MQLAADDAAHQGQTAVTTENMLVGFLRAYDGVFAGLFMGTGTDMPRLRAMIGERLRPDRDPLAGQELPAGADAEAAVRTAATEAEARHREVVSPHHLLFGIVSQETGAGALLLATLGASIAGLREQLRSYI
jgi:ATP-dependent Clp protease ATP-binding subunit ClpA